MPLHRVVWGLLLAASLGAFGAQDRLTLGRELSFAPDKGNCLACNVIAGGRQMVDVGPPLVGMRDRYPDRARLRAQIWDATRFNPDTLMPPFGRHRILNGEEIDLIVDFLYQL